jgi:hypothetical protein
LCEIRLAVISIVPVPNSVEVVFLADEDVGSKVFIKFIGPGEAGLTNVTQFEPFMLPTRRVALRASTAVMMRC